MQLNSSESGFNQASSRSSTSDTPDTQPQGAELSSGIVKGISIGFIGLIFLLVIAALLCRKQQPSNVRGEGDEWK